MLRKDIVDYVCAQWHGDNPTSVFACVLGMWNLPNQNFDVSYLNACARLAFLGICLSNKQYLPFTCSGEIIWADPQYLITQINIGDKIFWLYYIYIQTYCSLIGMCIQNKNYVICTAMFQKWINVLIHVLLKRESDIIYREVFCLGDSRPIWFWLAIISVWFPVVLGRGGCSSLGPPACCMWSVGCCCWFHCLLWLLHFLLYVGFLLITQQWHIVADWDSALQA